MVEYEINESTNAIIPISETQTKVIEDDNTYQVNQKAIKIIDDSCKYFGSSYSGRFEGAKKLLGPKIYKAPIIVEETKELIYFPTGSARAHDCTWISLKKVKEIKKSNFTSIVKFKNNQEIELDISFESLNNQLLRASRLESILRQRKSS